MVTEILIDLEKEFHICLDTKNLTLERRMHKAATAVLNSIIYF